MLGIGIFFIPVIFSWFTLRKGYSTLAKILSFVWLAIFFSIVLRSKENNIQKTVSIVETPAAVQPISNKPKTNPITDFILKADDSSMNSIKAKVAQDFEEQYNFTKQQGDKMEICVQAMSVSAAYLQAKDEENYKKWKQIEKADCKKSGMPS
ncbi:MAG: hypothetical protein RI956_132 [Pseudomonadota bacterium]